MASSLAKTPQSPSVVIKIIGQKVSVRQLCQPCSSPVVHRSGFDFNGPRTTTKTLINAYLKGSGGLILKANHILQK